MNIKWKILVGVIIPCITLLAVITAWALWSVTASSGAHIVIDGDLISGANKMTYGTFLYPILTGFVIGVWVALIWLLFIRKK